MRINKLKIKDLILIEPQIFYDNRGYFFESFNKKRIKEAINLDLSLVQCNSSLSYHGVVRGLHYQVNPKSQGKLIRVLKGEIYDVAVDIRHDSKSFGQYEALYLSEENKKMLWIPSGFAHGFMVTSEVAEIEYFVTDYYDSFLERGILWNDKEINIRWPLDKIKNNLIISDKDKKLRTFSEYKKTKNYI